MRDWDWTTWAIVATLVALAIFIPIAIVHDVRESERKQAACAAAGGRWVEDSQSFVGIAGTSTVVGSTDREFCVDKSGHEFWP